MNKVNCSRCDAEILQNTFKKCGGFCMPCFMEDNNGFRPSELSSLAERGLSEYFKTWNEFVRKGVPRTNNSEVVDKLNHYLPVIFASISGYLRFGEGSFDGKKNSELLQELIECSDGKLNYFLSDVEKYNYELMNATKNIKKQ